MSSLDSPARRPWSHPPPPAVGPAHTWADQHSARWHRRDLGV